MIQKLKIYISFGIGIDWEIIQKAIIQFLFILPKSTIIPCYVSSLIIDLNLEDEGTALAKVFLPEFSKFVKKIDQIDFEIVITSRNPPLKYRPISSCCEMSSSHNDI